MKRRTTTMPKAWRYCVWSLLALVVLIPLWTVVSGRAVVAWRPDWIESDEAMNKLMVWSVAGPVLLVAAVAGWRWSVASERARASAGETPVAAAAPAPEPGASRPDFVLEVIGLGVTLDKYRQGKLWAALSQGGPYASIREQDPKKYPWSGDQKDDQTGGRACDALENGARALPMYWGIPTFGAGWGSKEDIDRSGSVMCDPETSGMAFQLFVGAEGQEGEHTDKVMGRVFSFFDEHPDVPFIVVSSADDLYSRNLLRPKGTPPLVKDGYYIPSMPDSSALFVLARRERVDRIRPFVFDDVDEDKYLGEELNRRSPARKLMVAYMDLSEQLASKQLGRPADGLKRTPTVSEWLQATRAFAQRDDIYPRHFSIMNTFHEGELPPKDFKPTPWFPIPWDKAQLAAFDKLPTLGFIHRPVFVPMVDKDGHPLTRRDARTAALAAGWQQALQTLPEAERKAAPARVVMGTGGNVEQTIALHSVLNGWAAEGGPELDSSKPTQWIDTDARLGNTGAATWFMQMAIGVMGSYKDGGASAAINLRDPREASIVFITPPSDEKRRTQQNAAGGDVWRSIVGPAIDPANYQQP